MEDKMGGSNSTHGECEMHSDAWSENLKGSCHSEDLGIDGSIILEWILGK